MFEDDPPPLPSTPCVETSCDSTFADLSDHDRFTAVADDDYDGNDAEFRPHMSAVLQVESDSELVYLETITPHTESAKVCGTLDCAQNLVTGNLPHDDSDGQQNPSFSSLQSPPSQFAQISKLRDLSPEIPDSPEDSDVIKSVMAHSVQVCF